MRTARDEFSVTEDFERVLAKLFVFEHLCFKDQRFAAESEVRILRPVQVDEGAPNGLIESVHMTGGKQIRPLAVPFEIKIRNGRYGPTKYVELPYSYKTLSALRSVGFGPRCGEADERRIRERFAHLRGVEFWRSDLPLR